MPELVDSLANLTALRDRDALDVALVGTIRDLLQPETAAIYRCVGEMGDDRWLTCAHLTADQALPSSDSEWAHLDTLPKLADYPMRQRALESQNAVRSGGAPHVTVFPLATRQEAPRILELGTRDALPEDAHKLVSGILRLYRNFHGLLDYGERDSLTELLNRKTFDSAFMKATLELCKRFGDHDTGRRAGETTGSYWLAVIDIDHFKRVNDTFGHLIGDEVLLLLARLMRETFRQHDQLYRFGGEEFVVLMRCANEAAAALSLERFRTSTENHVFPQVGHITVSTGFSALHAGDTPSGAFERADKAVYFAKSHGRNRVCSYHALVALGVIVESVASAGDVELF